MVIFCSYKKMILRKIFDYSLYRAAQILHTKLAKNPNMAKLISANVQGRNEYLIFFCINAHTYTVPLANFSTTQSQ